MTLKKLGSAALLLAAWLMTATGANARDPFARGPVQADMKVIGSVMIGADGKLQSYVLPPVYPTQVQSLVKRYLAERSFDLKPTGTARGPLQAVMSLQLVARQNDRGGADISIADSYFQVPGDTNGITVRQWTLPTYPDAAGAYGFTGVVFLALRLAPDGTVAQTHVEQVNLTGTASERTLQRGRDLLADASTAQAKDWTFELAPELVAAQKAITVRIAVAFEEPPAKAQAKQTEATWQQYVPGPHVPIPWIGDASSKGLGAMVPGWLYPAEPEIQLRER